MHSNAAGLGSTALVLSIAAPFGGSYWYALTALSPLAGIYYWQRGSRTEEFAVRFKVLHAAIFMFSTCREAVCRQVCLCHGASASWSVCIRHSIKRCSSLLVSCQVQSPYCACIRSKVIADVSHA